jgi:hypothetical protein
MVSGIAEAPPAGLGKLLMESRFAVPNHQRDYSWTEQVKQLFDDIDSAIEANDPTYFLGLMVFMGSESGELIVLDGQQRLATGVIFISAVRSWLSQYSQHQKDASQIQDWFIGRSELGETALQPRLIMNSANNQAFSDYIVKAVPIEHIRAALATLKRQDRNRNLLEAALYCRERVAQLASTTGNPDETAKKLIKIVVYLRDSANAARLIVSSEAAAFTIFETLNDRGLELSPLDLVKNYLFGKAEAHSKPRIRDMESRWTQMMAMLANVKADNFLKAFWTSRHGRIQNPLLFGALKRQCSTPDSVLQLSMDLLVASEQYAAFESADDPVWAPHTKETREYIRSLKVLSSQQIHPVMLAALSKFSTHEVERLLRLLEVLIVRYQLIGGGRTGVLEISLAKLAKAVFDGKAGDSVVASASDAFREIKDIYPNDDDFQTAFRAKQERSNPKAQYLLRCLEMEERRLALPGMSQEEELGTLTVEHILPKSPGANWEQVVNADDALIEDCLFKIGNLTLLTKVNKDLGTASFDEKKAVYGKSSIIITNQLAKQSSWDRQAIDHRQARMAMLAVSAWRFQ